MPDMFLKPEETIEAWDVRPGEKIADFGCGAGYFSIPLGQRVGSSGKVYAIDIRQEALEATRAKARLLHLFDIEPTRADLETLHGSNLKDGTMDKVIISNILFQAENKDAVVSEAYRILKPGGTVLAIEWNEEGVTGGPGLEQRIAKAETEKIFQRVGFSFYKEVYAGSHHYGLIFKK